LKNLAECQANTTEYSWSRGDEFIAVSSTTVEKGIILGIGASTTNEDCHSRSPFKVILSSTSIVEGGGIHNTNAELIGIKNSDNSMIPYSTIRAHLEHLYASSLTVVLPSFDLNWSCCSREMIESYTGSSSLNGIVVTKLGDNSILQDLKEGDLITHITYINYMNELNCCFLDRYGEVVVCKIPISSPHYNNRSVIEAKPNNQDLYISSHKRSLSEIVDSIPIGSNITLQICRNRTWYRLHSQNLPIKDRIYNLPHYISMDYELFCGMCILEMSSTLVVSHIFPSSIISSLNIDNIPPHSILREVDSCKVNTLQQLRDCIKATSDNKRISLKIISEFIFSRYDMGLYDSQLSKDYSICLLHTALINSMSEVE
jgi:hypothetical protein